MLSAPSWLTALGLGTFALTACAESTGPSAATLQAQRAQWTAQAVTNYTYVYRVIGFFINYAGQDITLTVRNDSVVAAVTTTTGEPRSPIDFPTIDELFEEANAALAAGQLTRIEFDARLGYPLRIDLAGPPDASGSIFSSQLQRAP